MIRRIEKEMIMKCGNTDNTVLKECAEDFVFED